MKIETSKSMTVSELRALLVGADDSTQIEFVKTTVAKPMMTGECWCGCGGETKGKFVPGHDSKFHSLAKKVARGQAEMPTSFVHEDAVADFMKWHDATVAADAAKPAKAVKTKATKAVVKDVVKDVVTEVKSTVVEDSKEDNDEGVDNASWDNAEDGELDPNSDEFKALMASVTMS